MRQIMLALSDYGCLVFRANVGHFKTEDGRWINSGLPVGFSDLFGTTPHGRSFYCEVKLPGCRATLEQKNFLNAARSHGALAFVAHSVIDAITNLETELCTPSNTPASSHPIQVKNEIHTPITLD